MRKINATKCCTKLASKGLHVFFDQAYYESTKLDLGHINIPSYTHVPCLCSNLVCDERRTQVRLRRLLVTRYSVLAMSGCKFHGPYYSVPIGFPVHISRDGHAIERFPKSPFDYENIQIPCAVTMQANCGI
jgi:hypothetical protein